MVPSPSRRAWLEEGALLGGCETALPECGWPRRSFEESRPGLEESCPGSSPAGWQGQGDMGSSDLRAEACSVLTTLG